jgi:hypothetical protein
MRCKRINKGDQYRRNLVSLGHSRMISGHEIAADEDLVAQGPLDWQPQTGISRRHAVGSAAGDRITSLR